MADSRSGPHRALKHRPNVVVKGLTDLLYVFRVMWNGHAPNGRFTISHSAPYRVSDHFKLKHGAQPRHAIIVGVRNTESHTHLNGREVQQPGAMGAELRIEIVPAVYPVFPNGRNT